MESAFPPALSYTSFAIGITSFALTILNLIALYADMVSTLRVAPREIRDSLGNLRLQIVEEREALKRQTEEMRARANPDYSPSPQRSRRHRRRRRSRPDALLAVAQNHYEKTLSLHYATLSDLWREFKALERPFLVASGSRAEAIRHGGVWHESDIADEEVRTELEKHGETNGYNNFEGFYRCDFSHRFIWWQSKGSVRLLADKVQRIMLRRMAREVTEIQYMVDNLMDRGGIEDVGSRYARTYTRGESRHARSRRGERY